MQPAQAVGHSIGTTPSRISTVTGKGPLGEALRRQFARRDHAW
jgi:hypothetical protein